MSDVQPWHCPAVNASWIWSGSVKVSGVYVMPASAAAVARLSSVVVPDSTQIVVPSMSAIEV